MASAEHYRPLAEVFGTALQVEPLPDRWTPIEGVFVVKCLDAKGAPTWAVRETDAINAEEMIGVLTVQLDIMREQVVDAYRDADGNL